MAYTIYQYVYDGHLLDTNGEDIGDTAYMGSYEFDGFQVPLYVYIPQQQRTTTSGYTVQFYLDVSDAESVIGNVSTVSGSFNLRARTSNATLDTVYHLYYTDYGSSQTRRFRANLTTTGTGTWTFRSFELGSLTITASGGTEYTSTGSPDLDNETTGVGGYYVTTGDLTYRYYFLLNYNANGGESAPSSQRYPTSGYAGTATYSELSTLTHSFTITSTTPTRDGYTFLGWARSSAATTATYWPGGTITVNALTNVTLYAVWQSAGPSYAVYVKAGGAWHEADAVHVRSDGEWHEADSVLIRDGSWRESS